jgi:hypothetical protein
MPNIHGLGTVADKKGAPKVPGEPNMEEFSGGGAQSSTAVQRKVKGDIGDILSCVPLASRL